MVGKALKRINKAKNRFDIIKTLQVIDKHKGRQ